jgi:glutamyl-tRNA reductase
MDRIGIVGLSWRSTRVEALAPFTLTAEVRAARLPQIAREAGVCELVYLATCNRVELAFVGDGHTPLAAYRPRLYAALLGRAAPAGEAERSLRAWAGEGAVEHLALVTSGLEAVRIGESEIAAQVRTALELSRALGLVGERLGRVFDEALRIAKRVHGLRELETGRTSIAELALDLLRERIARADAAPTQAAEHERDEPPSALALGGDHSGSAVALNQSTPMSAVALNRNMPMSAVALIGVSPMTQRCARELVQQGVRPWIVNRTLARAQELAQSLGLEALALDEFAADPPPLVALLSATGAREPVLEAAALERIARRAPARVLAVDLAIPPDIDPAQAERAGIERVGMDWIAARAAHNRDQRAAQLAEARALVDHELLGLRKRLQDRALGPLLAVLQHEQAEHARRSALELLEGELAGLDARQRAALLEFAQALARRHAHAPCAGLRALAHEHGLSAVEAYARAAGGGLAAALAAEPLASAAPRLRASSAEDASA